MNKLWIHIPQRLAWSFSLAWVIFSCTKVSPTNSYLFTTSVPGLWRSGQWFPLLVCLCPPLKTHLLLLSDSSGNFTYVFLLRPHVSKWRKYNLSCLFSQVLPITPSWPCWTLSTTSSAASPSPSARRPSLFSPLRLRSPGWRRSWWPSHCHCHLLLAFLPGRASFGVDYRLFYWEEGRRPETCSCGNWVKDAAERVWESPDHQRRFQRRGNGEGWCWKPGGLRSRKRPVSKKFWVVLSVIHAWALFDKWMSEILRNMCTLRAFWNAGVLIQTSSGGHIVECPIPCIMYILVYIEQNVLFWPRSDPKSPCPSRSSIGRRWMVGAV